MHRTIQSHTHTLAPWTHTHRSCQVTVREWHSHSLFADIGLLFLFMSLLMTYVHKLNISPLKSRR